MGIAVSLDIAMRALLAQQAAVDAVAHNISNVATPGYTRQRVKMQALQGFGSPALPSAGGGVSVVSVDRVRDLFVDFQIRTANHNAGRHEARTASLRQVEIALAEPSDSGLRAAMSRFWNAWRDLSNSPDLTATRAVLVEASKDLASTAQTIRGSFVRLRAEADARMVAGANEINALATEISSLNQQIAELVGIGNRAPDLSDQRDLAMDRLSVLIDVRYRERDDGRIDVTIGGRSIVRGTQAFAIYGDPNVGNSNYVDLKFVADDADVTITSGQLGGLLEQRDTYLTARIGDLDALMGEMITDVNVVHAAGRGLDGTTGIAFFTGTDASDIAVNTVVSGDLDKLAAATNWSAGDGTPPGDGTNAAAISDLQYASQAALNNDTYDEFYESVVSSIGAAVRGAQRLAQGQNLLVTQLEQVRQSTSGVNLDEELVQLNRYQRAYQAAARLISVIDDMLDQLINRTI